MKPYRWAIVLVALGLGAWLSHQVLQSRFLSSYPRTPLPAEGKTTPLTQRGLTVYVSPLERQLFILNYFAIVLFPVGLAWAGAIYVNEQLRNER